MGREREFGPDEKMLRAMLEFEPDQRITTKDVVASEWMRRWGLQAMKH